MKQEQSPLDVLMRQLSPVLLQLWLEKQRNKMYLDRTRQAYGEYGRQQRMTLDQGLQNAVWEAIMRSSGEWAKDQPFSPEVVIDTLMKYLPSNLTSQLQLPEDATARIAAARQAGVNLAGGQQAGAPVGPATLAATIQGYGLTPATKGAESIVRTTEKRADRTEREKSREQRERELGVKQETLEVRKQELAAKKAGKTTESEAKKKKEKVLEKYLTERARLEDNILKTIHYEPGEKPKVRARIDKLTAWINGLQKELGMRSDKEYQKLVDDLKNLGITRSDLQAGIRISLKDLEDKGYEIWVLMGYLPESYETEASEMKK